MPVLCMNCSVGIPYKEAVIEFCDEVHPLAQVDPNFLEFVFSCLSTFNVYSKSNAMKHIVGWCLAQTLVSSSLY